MESIAYTLLVLICLLLGLLAGVVMHRSDYCLAGIFRDLFLFRHTVMIRTLVLLVVSTMALFESARQLGILPLYPFPLLYPPTPANVLGGFMFGIGMVLAGGCAVGTLYKAGAGSALSCTALGGLVAGSTLYAEIHPLWAAFIKSTTFFPGKITVSQIMGVDPLLPVAVAVLSGIPFIARWYRDGSMVRPSFAAGYLQPWKAALILSAISLASYVLVGMPLGITTAYAKTGAYIEQALFGAHLDSLAYFKLVSLKYTHPLTGMQLQGGPGPRFDAFSIIQYSLLAGIIAGSAISAIALNEFRIYLKVPPRQYLSAFAGGVIMGLAARMAPTCNVWHLMGGIPILAASSILFLAGLVPGAWAGSRILSSVVIAHK